MRSPVTRSLMLLLGLFAFLGAVTSGTPGPGRVGRTSEVATPVGNGWLPGSWAHRIRLTVKPDSVEGTGSLINFPVLLKLGPTQASVFASANANGSDLMLTKGDGITVLGHEVVSFDPVGKRAEIWFRADSLAKAQNTFYLYYGNPTHTTFPPAGAAWNSKYLAVYHFSENPGLGVLKDWGPRGNNANAAASGANWTAGDVTAGQEGQAWNFNGTTHYIQAFAIGTLDTSYVISAWLKCPSNTTDFTFQANPGFWHVSAQINEMHRQPHYNAAIASDLRWEPRPLPNDNLFHYYTWVFDGEADTILFYFDGVVQPATPWNLDPSLKHFYTGRPINPTHSPADGVGILGPIYWNSYDLMTGPGDEFHLNERTHSGPWIRTEYRNQRDPQNFYQFGSEETSGSVPVLLLDYSAVREGSDVRLHWRTASTGGDLTGFLVFRDDAGQRVRITSQLLPESSEYTWVDTDAPIAASVYWLMAVSRTGESTWLGPIQVASVANLGRPSAVLLYARPNPFRQSVQFGASLSQNGRVTLRVLDPAGREVRRLLDQIAGPGTVAVSWDGRDQKGMRTSPGAYVITLESGTVRSSRKVLLLP
jgi:flagellar hook capping protein FlgD/uncharacterized protein DUF2341